MTLFNVFLNPIYTIFYLPRPTFNIHKATLYIGYYILAFFVQPSLRLFLRLLSRLLPSLSVRKKPTSPKQYRYQQCKHIYRAPRITNAPLLKL
ncbi:hypothetical protein NNJEOMEG_00533 [Fundidesulfovibrio magnetotacticus]|uniref:Uncharacterized protein n=1 Tax=Fundidesulfovibrio magnetotacticus TaxID=2730080 RepID=A0A6V8LSW1_9BACT|nr:hypothetical protein NNJEOMEG_00533 [Fundidesulfovibrio magnetotacticus]